MSFASIELKNHWQVETLTKLRKLRHRMVISIQTSVIKSIYNLAH